MRQTLRIDFGQVPRPTSRWSGFLTWSWRRCRNDEGNANLRMLMTYLNIRVEWNSNDGEDSIDRNEENSYSLKGLHFFKPAERCWSELTGPGINRSMRHGKELMKAYQQLDVLVRYGRPTEQKNKCARVEGHVHARGSICVHFKLHPLIAFDHKKIHDWVKFLAILSLGPPKS